MELSTIMEGQKGTWHKFPGTDFEVCIKTPKPSEMRAMHKRCFKKVPGGDQTDYDVDMEAFNDMLLRACVVDWRGLEFEGKPFPCTDENKRHLDNEWGQFAAFWQKVYKDITENEAKSLEEQLGNLKLGQGTT